MSMRILGHLNVCRSMLSMPCSQIGFKSIRPQCTTIPREMFLHHTPRLSCASSAPMKCVLPQNKLPVEGRISNVAQGVLGLMKKSEMTFEEFKENSLRDKNLKSFLEYKGAFGFEGITTKELKEGYENYCRLEYNHYKQEATGFNPTQAWDKF